MYKTNVITFVLDHCKEDECCFDSGGDDCVWMVGVFCEACLLLLSAAEDDDGPEGAIFPEIVSSVVRLFKANIFYR